MSKKWIVSVRLDAEVYGKLRRLAAQRNCTLSDLMRQAAADEVDKGRPAITFTWTTPNATTTTTSATSTGGTP